MKTVEQLKAAWESAPRDNPWEELGLEEIVAFAQEDAEHIRQVYMEIHDAVCQDNDKVYGMLRTTYAQIGKFLKGGD